MKSLVLNVAWFISATFTALALAADDSPPSPPVSPPVPPTVSDPSAVPVAPRIRFDATVFDFGKVATGQPIQHTFIVSNAGNASLVISSVHPSCGCTTAGEFTKEIQPGMTGKIPVQINSAYLHGTIDKTVTVTSNDKAQPAVTLRMHGAVWKPIEVSPAFAFLHLNPGSPTNKTTVHITNQTDEAVVLSAPESTDKLFIGTIKTLQPGKEFELTVSAAEPFPSGSVQASMSIKTSLASMPVLSIPVTAISPRPAVLVTPAKISLAPPAAGQNVITQKITIQATAPQALHLSDASVNAQDVDVQVKEVLPGRSYNLTLTFPQGFQVPQGQEVVLSVKSNYPQFPVIRVPITQPSASTVAARKG